MKNIDDIKATEYDNNDHIIQNQKMSSNGTATRQVEDILKKTLLVCNRLLSDSSGKIDFQKITDTILEISGAKYATFNLFDDDGRDFSTQAFSGLGKNAQKISSVLGFELVGKKWKYDPVREKKLKGNSVTYFESLHSLSESALPGRISSFVERVFNIGPVYVVKINKNDIAIGDFTLLFPRGASMQNQDIVELFSNQVGLLIERNRTDVRLIDSELRYKSFIASSPIAIEIYDSKGALIDVNPACLDLFGIKSKKEIEHFSLYDDPNISFDHKNSLKQAKPIRYEAEFDFDVVKQKKLYTTSKSGKIWLDVMITPTTEASGSPTGFLLEIQDITSKKVSINQANEDVGELEKINSIMVGRELKMIELKKEIENLKSHIASKSVKSDDQYVDGIKLEEDVIQALSHDYKELINNSQLSKSNKSKIVKKLRILEIDSIGHEKRLKELSRGNK